MSDYQAHLGLLPEGFVDLMPEEAEQEIKAIQILMDVFAGYGYARIKPPLLEFEDSLLAPGPGAALAADTFRLMDPVSHRMLGLRADITPQIARIICTRLPPDIAPIRLTYANDVLRTRAGQVRSSRQFTQVGCEIIRDDSPESSVEICMLALFGLKAIGIENITLDFTLPRLFEKLCNHFAVSDHNRKQAKSALIRRERDGLKGIDPNFEQILVSLLEGQGSAENTLKIAIALDLPSEIHAEIKTLQQVVGDIRKALEDLNIDDVNLTYDPFETSGFEYHTGMAFTLFAEGVRGELGRGGHYTVSFGSGKNAVAPQKALGFTLYMDTIRPSLKPFPRAQIVAVGIETSWIEIAKLRQDGWIVLRIKSEADIPENCLHIYKNGTCLHIKKDKA
jgi:ATP phosphoribosyltransferase regulatory subunit